MGDGSPLDSKPQPLFRPEVALRRSNEWLGEVQVSQPLAVRIPLLVGLLFLLLGLVLIVVISYTARVPVHGELLPAGGVITVESDLAGTVSAVHVNEGRRAEVGEVIAIVNSPRETADGDSLLLIRSEMEARERGYSEMLVQLDKQRLQMLSDANAEIEHLKEDLTVLEQQAQIISAKEVLAKDALTRMHILREQKLVSTLELSRYESELLGVRTNELEWRRAVSAAQRQIAVVERMSSERVASIKTERNRIKQELSSVRQELAESLSRSQRIVRAPVTGQVSARLVGVGQAISAGQPLITITPENAELEAVLNVPSKAIASLAEGDELMLRIEAYPYQRFGLQRAIVNSVSGTTIPSGENQPTYQVRARMLSQNIFHEGRGHALLPGMKVDAIVLVDQGSPGWSLVASLRYHLKEMLGR
jgi:membrane fusion protein